MLIDISPRQYQQKIFETAKDRNTLVVLPTGLGKTLIALLITVERLKAFAPSKVLFLAPTRPLAEQHYEYFQKHLSELYADRQLFTGEVPAIKRKKIFQTAEIIFSTPQCIGNDLVKGLYNLEEVSLIIFDEAHRCLKNYDYTKVVDFYKRQARNQRIIGLTASPGSDPALVREICRHLDVEEIEIRSRESSDVKPYLQEREFEKVEVKFPTEFIEMKILLRRIFDAQVDQLKKRGLLQGPANKITLLMLQNRLASQAQGNDFNAMRGMSLTAQAIKISHAQELLETQTLSGLKDYLEGLVQQANEKKSRGVQKLVAMPEFQAARISLDKVLGKGMEHPKIEETAKIISKEMTDNPLAKIMIFSQFRETSASITRRLNQIQGVRSAMFVGQAKKKETGLSQKEQKEVISQFKEGAINVLCATSIGEEGLDIPEVNAVLFYEPIPSAIRKIQRAGRTARVVKGKLIILVTKGTKDEISHYVSGARERKMYKTLEQIKSQLAEEKKNPSLDSFLDRGKIAKA